MSFRRCFRPTFLARMLGTVVLAGATTASAAPLLLAEVPLFTLNNGKANLLVMFGNSNSMDEDPTGLAVGSDHPESRSEIARGVIMELVETYTNRVNMGLIAYQQMTSGADPVRLASLHNSPYDVSYDPANYLPSFAGARDSTIKKFRLPNPTSPGDFVYFNVNLPLYTSGSNGNGFCYSPTARAFNNGEDPVLGPWDTYTCYANKVGTSDALPDSDASAAAAGYSEYKLSPRIYPSDSDLGQGITDFGRFMTWAYVGPSWFSNGSPGKGYVHVPIEPLSGTHAAKIRAKLGTSQFSLNNPVDWRYPLQNAGLTPLEGTMQTALSYFQGRLSDATEGGPLPAPSTNSCDKKFVAMLTNGLPSVTAAGAPSSDTTAMLASLSRSVQNLHDAEVMTYVVGFALPYGVNPSQLQTIADAGVGGEAGAGTVYYATDEATLRQQLNEVFTDIFRQTGAASAVALNSTSVSSRTRVYQAQFNSADWSGRLLGVPVDMSTGLPLEGDSSSWDAAEELNALAPDDRTIITYRPSDGRGVPFRWPGSGSGALDPWQVDALDTNPGTRQKDSLGEVRLAYLRGDRSAEGVPPYSFRRRPGGKLGDIVNSAPAFVGAPAFNYPEVGYRTFRSAHRDRTPMIYVGANDGMLHGFSAETGVEQIAYVPSRVFSKLNRLTRFNYSHTFYVNGMVSSGDVSYDDEWHTVLVAALGAGGRGIVALDVTDPDAFSESAANAIVNFEYSDANDADVGYVTGVPNIVKLANGRWAAVFGNGYNSTGNGKASLFVVDIETGDLIRKIATSGGTTATPNALTSVVAIDSDGNRAADVAYGGDLLGNLWKFDLSDSNPSNWHVAYSGTPLYTATDGAGNVQPITTTPDVGRHPAGGLLVYFGTGKYLEAADLTNTASNAVYAVRDNGAPVAKALLEQTVTGTQVIGAGAAAGRYRLASQNPIDWTRQDGWFIALPESGERAVADPILRNGRLIFTSLIPAKTSCYGGSSWLMELDYLTGGQIAQPVLDTNRDSTIDSSETPGDGSDTPVAGVGWDTIASMPGILAGFGTQAEPLEKKFLNQSDGTLVTLTERGNSLANRRTAWQELPLQ